MVNVIGVASLIAIAAGVFLHHAQARLAWGLILLGQTLYVAGDFYTYTIPTCSAAPSASPRAATRSTCRSTPRSSAG